MKLPNTTRAGIIGAITTMVYDEIKKVSINWIHFFCGAILGAFVGLWTWFRTGASESLDLGIALIGGFALALGLASGVFWARLWKGLKDRIKRWRFQISVTLFALAAVGYLVFWLVMPPRLQLDLKRIDKERDTRGPVKYAKEELPVSGEVAQAMRSHLDELQGYFPPGKYHPSSPFAVVEKVTMDVSKDDSVEYHGKFYNDMSITLHHDMTLRSLRMHGDEPADYEVKERESTVALISRSEAMAIVNNILDAIGSEVRCGHQEDLTHSERGKCWYINEAVERHGIPCPEARAMVSLDEEGGYLKSLWTTLLTFSPEYTEPRVSPDRAVRIAFRSTHAPLHALWARLTGADMVTPHLPPKLVFLSERSVKAKRSMSFAKHISRVPPGNRLCWEVEFTNFQDTDDNCMVTVDAQTGDIICVYIWFTGYVQRKNGQD